MPVTASATHGRISRVGGLAAGRRQNPQPGRPRQGSTRRRRLAFPRNHSLILRSTKTPAAALQVRISVHPAHPVFKGGRQDTRMDRTIPFAKGPFRRVPIPIFCRHSQRANRQRRICGSARRLSSAARSTHAHRQQKLNIAPRLLQLVQHEFHRFHWRHAGERPAQNDHAVVFIRMVKQLFLPRA